METQPFYNSGIVAGSIFTFPFSDFQSLVAADFVKEGLARDEPCLRAVMHGVRGLLARFVAVAPKRSGAVHAIFVDSVKINVEGAELFLVVLIVASNAGHG